MSWTDATQRSRAMLYARTGSTVAVAKPRRTLGPLDDEGRVVLDSRVLQHRRHPVDEVVKEVGLGVAEDLQHVIEERLHDTLLPRSQRAYDGVGEGHDSRAQVELVGRLRGLCRIWVEAVLPIGRLVEGGKPDVPDEAGGLDDFGG